ncbi:MAG: HigA family addiction module antitoxin [Saprospiraceae bacterium]|nr:HigA family addiction module antitoxin [Saprospiraceae bacterium]
MIENHYHPPIAFHPGETLAEKLEELGMDSRGLAEATGLTEAEVGGIRNCSVRVVPDTAVGLERVWGIPARFWLSMQEAFDAFQTSKNTNP